MRRELEGLERDVKLNFCDKCYQRYLAFVEPRIRARGEPWPSLFYSNLVHNFNQEITSGGEENQGNFAQSAVVQEIINAVELSHRERRWVDLPLDR